MKHQLQPISESCIISLLSNNVDAIKSQSVRCDDFRYIDTKWMLDAYIHSFSITPCHINMETINKIRPCKCFLL